MRDHSQMRQGEITLQKIRINKKVKNRKDIAYDVFKMLNDIEGRETIDIESPKAFVEEKFGTGTP